jgi:Flavin containing amine oxidoreductase
VVVEETFTLSSGQNNHGKVGDGVYVSATTAGNKRYYGVLINQPALKEATSLWFRDQADSLELNKRIRVLQQQQHHSVVDDGKVASSGEHDTNASSFGQIGYINGQNTGEEIDSKSEGSAIHQAGVEEVPRTLNGTCFDPALPSLEGGTTGTTTLPRPPLDLDSNAENDSDPSKKRPLGESTEQPASKQVRVEDQEVTRTAANAPENLTGLQGNNDRPVQKFKYVNMKKSDDPGYRVLVATFSNVEEAASGDLKLARAIQKACEEGGNYLHGDPRYYYQYEVLPAVLTSSDSEKISDYDIRTSMGLHTFLQNTHLPAWFPLSNLQSRHGRVLNMLNMKKDNHGNITWDDRLPDTAASGDGAANLLAGGTRVTMQPRPKKRYQIGVLGGGIAGLACCRELVTRMERDGIDYHITLFEARSRLGGRLWTDSSDPSDEHGTIPIELGASWIHGIDDNPLAVLAQEAGVEFVTASEEVQMLGEGMRRIDAKLDEAAGKLFDDLLDLAADDCWSAPETVVRSEHDGGHDPQAVVRWYSSIFADENGRSVDPPLVDAPSHRRSSDRSIDVEMGKVVLKHKLRNVSKLSADEHRMLLWNTKNVEYALGANISDLSMKYWDADERRLRKFFCYFCITRAHRIAVVVALQVTLSRATMSS